MEVELALDIDQYEEWELLEKKGWGDYAYKKVYLPIVFVGLTLYIPYVDSKGGENELGFVVIDVTYFLKHRILQVGIKLEEPYFLCELVTVENGWSKESVLFL